MGFYEAVPFVPAMLEDDNIREVASSLNDIMLDYSGNARDIDVKVVYADGTTDVYDHLRTGREDDDIISYEGSFGRQPPTTSAKLEIVFDQTSFVLETRQDWLVEWYQEDGVVSLTSNRPSAGVDGDYPDKIVTQIIISVPRD